LALSACRRSLRCAHGSDKRRLAKNVTTLLSLALLRTGVALGDAYIRAQAGASRADFLVHLSVLSRTRDRLLDAVQLEN
jgi:hypothetical protein